MEVNKIYTENCLDTMARMPDSFVDLVVTSPPYDNLRKYKGYSFEFEKIAIELFRVVKTGGVVVWVVGDATLNGSESGTSFKQALFFMRCGFNLHDTMIYQKVNYVPLTHNRYEQSFEYMFIFSKSKPKTFNPIMIDCKLKGKMRSKTSTFRHTGENTSKLHSIKEMYGDKKIKSNVFSYITNASIKGHPAIFPEQLAMDHITTWSNENDLVYDCFGGSGTVGKICKIKNRNYILSEISEDYSQIAEKRIA
jgi:DNA modification methylase